MRKLTIAAFCICLFTAGWAMAEIHPGPREGCPICAAEEKLIQLLGTDDQVAIRHQQAVVDELRRRAGVVIDKAGIDAADNGDPIRLVTPILPKPGTGQAQPRVLSAEEVAKTVDDIVNQVLFSGKGEQKVRVGNIDPEQLSQIGFDVREQLRSLGRGEEPIWLDKDALGARDLPKPGTVAWDKATVEVVGTPRAVRVGGANYLEYSLTVAAPQRGLAGRMFRAVLKVLTSRPVENLAAKVGAVFQKFIPLRDEGAASVAQLRNDLLQIEGVRTVGMQLGRTIVIERTRQQGEPSDDVS